MISVLQGGFDQVLGAILRLRWRAVDRGGGSGLGSAFCSRFTFRRFLVARERNIGRRLEKLFPELRYPLDITRID